MIDELKVDIRCNGDMIKWATCAMFYSELSLSYLCNQNTRSDEKDEKLLARGESERETWEREK